MRGSCDVKIRQVRILLCLLLGFLLGGGMLRSCYAAVGLGLEQVKLGDLVRIVYGDLVPRAYVVSGEVKGLDALVTVQAHGLDAAGVEAVLLRLLEENSVRREDVGGVLRFRAVTPLEQAAKGRCVQMYRPQYRDSRYLSSAVGSAVQGVSFSAKRGIQTSSSPSAQGSEDSSKGSPDSGGAALLDRDVDVLLMSGACPDVAQAVEWLGKLDVQVGEVTVRGVLLEVQKSSEDRSAISVLAKLFGGGIEVAYSSEVSQQVLKVKWGDLAVVLSGLANDSGVRILSRPYLRVKSGGKARLSVGDDVPVLGGSSVTGTGIVSQDVSYKSSGIILEISPIVRGAVVDLELSQQISTFAKTVTSSINSPTLLKREISTSLSVQPGEMLVIGGLDQSRDAQDATGLRFLPQMLWSRGGSKNDTEVVLLLDCASAAR